VRLEQTALSENSGEHRERRDTHGRAQEQRKFSRPDIGRSEMGMKKERHEKDHRHLGEEQQDV
jgi:hypothetical protein